MPTTMIGHHFVLRVLMEPVFPHGEGRSMITCEDAVFALSIRTGIIYFEYECTLLVPEIAWGGF